MRGTWRRMTYFAFSLSNQPGKLARFAEHLRQAGINLMGLWGYAGAEPSPRISCVPESADDFRRFAVESGLDIEEGDALFFCGDDTAGALADMLRRISDAGVNVDAVEAVGTGDAFGCFIWCDMAHMKKLESILAVA